MIVLLGQVRLRQVEKERAAGSAHEEATHWIATLQYAYADPSNDPKVRSWNPLGFKIIDFKPEREVLNETAAATRTPSSAPPK